MSINIPNKDQWAKMNDRLNSIAVTLGSRVDTYTWVGIRNVVRSGLAPKLFPIGTQFNVSHSEYGDIVFDVVAHDYFKSSKDANAHTMTLLSHDIIDNLMFDAGEAFYFAESELPAGTYNFTIDVEEMVVNEWVLGTYQFTLTKALPKGGQLTMTVGNTATSSKVRSYASCTATTPLETVDITSGGAGTSLGTVGQELNSTHLVLQGYCGYTESAIRQFLNSSAEAGEVWTPQTKFDRAPTWVSTLPGFMKGLNNDFLSVVGEVAVPCLDVNGKCTVNDKFYLASVNEIRTDRKDWCLDDTSQFPYYYGATLSDYVKYNKGVATRWGLRSYDNISNDSHSINNTGEFSWWSAYVPNGVVPACTIV